jgi:glutamate---cysteine ligase / carboxylate-amine ligase
MGDVRRKVGVEEELLLVDPDTGQSRAISPRVLHEHRVSPAARRDEAHTDLDPELQQHMVETRTEPDRELKRIGDQVIAGRRTAFDAATSAGASIAALGTAPLMAEDPPLTDHPRYQRIGEQYGRLGRTAGTFGMHVHVDIASDEEGVRVLDGVRPWLPVLVALAANSPYAENADTGYASWRQLVWSRWPSAGPAEPFGSVAEYRRVATALVDTGAALDDGGLYFDARLAARYPTVEIRVADVCTDVDDGLLVAALCRGLVDTAAHQEAPPDVRSDLLRAAYWRAARYGTDGDLVHPVSGDLAPAAEVISTLVREVEPALDAAGDLDLVVAGVERIATAGTGARRQRQAFETGGDLVAVVRDAVERTGARAG